MNKATLWEHLNQNIMFLGAVVLKRRLGKEVSIIPPQEMYGSQISFGPRNFLGHFYQLLRFSMDKATLQEQIIPNSMFLSALVFENRLGKKVPKIFPQECMVVKFLFLLENFWDTFSIFCDFLRIWQLIRSKSTQTACLQVLWSLSTDLVEKCPQCQ